MYENLNPSVVCLTFLLLGWLLLFDVLVVRLLLLLLLLLLLCVVAGFDVCCLLSLLSSFAVCLSIVGCWLLVASCWVDYWLLIVGCTLDRWFCWLLVGRCWLLVAACWLLVPFEHRRSSYRVHTDFSSFFQLVQVSIFPRPSVLLQDWIQAVSLKALIQSPPEAFWPCNVPTACKRATKGTGSHRSGQATAQWPLTSIAVATAMLAVSSCRAPMMAANRSASAEVKRHWYISC